MPAAAEPAVSASFGSPSCWPRSRSLRGTLTPKLLGPIRNFSPGRDIGRAQPDAFFRIVIESLSWRQAREADPFNPVSYHAGHGDLGFVCPNALRKPRFSEPSRHDD